MMNDLPLPSPNSPTAVEKSPTPSAPVPVNSKPAPREPQVLADLRKMSAESFEKAWNLARLSLLIDQASRAQRGVGPDEGFQRPKPEAGSEDT